tara:strand:+ start:2274 stop:3338 length:1065 start_codon:yes stop_codon:yes gene_type:complete
MNNRNNNKRNNVQKTNQKINNLEDNSISTKKDLNSESLIDIILNKYKILTFAILILGLFLIVTLMLSFWIYSSNFKQDQLLVRLSNQLELMPKPISQGRIGLIIKKANDALTSEINSEILSINKKIKKIEFLINSFPKPISEGKIGLILDKKIKKINSNLENKIKQNFLSKNNTLSFSKQNENMINEIKVEIENLQLSLEKLSKVTETKETENSLPQEIIELKSQKNIQDLQTSSLRNKKDNQINTINITKELSLIIKQFADFSYKAIKKDLMVNKETGLINSVINNFQLIFVQRSLTPQIGDTVDAILSRAEYALSNNNYEKVFEELNTLPNEASLVMDEWRTIFEDYLENNS